MRQKRILIVIAVFLLGAMLSGSARAEAFEYTEDNNYIYYEAPYLEQNTVYLAKGGANATLSINNGTLLSVISSNSSIAAVTAEGTVMPGEAGQAELTVLVTDSQGTVQTLYCTVYVTEYRLSQTEIKISMNQSPQATIYLQGMVYEYGYEGLEIEASITDNSVAEAYLSWDNSITIYGRKAGKTSLQVKIGGVVLECPIEVSAVSLNKTSVQTYPGKKITLKLTGSKEAVTWISSDKKIATVSSKGIVTAKKRGTVCITAKTESAEVHCYVSVSSKKAIQAVNKAKSVLGATYSQEKRMQKGYYDCSSLVWRSYSPYGIYLGNRNWAPTAADQGKWCSQNKKVIAKKAISTESLKLQPGDLIFYQRDVDNGRYKKIYHVAMFVGYEEITDWWGSSYLTATLVEADGIQVSLRSYIEDYGGGKKIVLIARPS